MLAHAHRMQLSCWPRPHNLPTGFDAGGRGALLVAASNGKKRLFLRRAFGIRVTYQYGVGERVVFYMFVFLFLLLVAFPFSSSHPCFQAACVRF